MTDSARPYEIVFELRDGYLYARIIADIGDVDLSVAQFKEVISRCNELNATRLLVEHTVPRVLSMPEMFDAAAGVVQLGLTGIKIAYVDTNPDHIENVRFAELVGTNRGANAKVFVSVGEAEAWLLSN